MRFLPNRHHNRHNHDIYTGTIRVCKYQYGCIMFVGHNGPQTICIHAYTYIYIDKGVGVLTPADGSHYVLSPNGLQTRIYMHSYIYIYIYMQALTPADGSHYVLSPNGPLSIPYRSNMQTQVNCAYMYICVSHH